VTGIDRAALAAALPAYEVGQLRGVDADGWLFGARERGGAARDVVLTVSRWRVTTSARRHRFAGEVARAAAVGAAGHAARLHASGLLPTGQPYLVTESCPWSLAGAGPLPAAAVVALGVEAARTLDAVHRTGAVHGDVTPRALVRRSDGTLVFDVFGVDTMVTAEQPVVKAGLLCLAYTAREVIYGGRPTVAADVYGLAATLYAALRGWPPRFPADREPGIAEQVAMFEQAVPDIAGVPADLLALLRRGLDNDPGRRQRSAGEMAEELSGLRYLT
jgi:serine/threonine protein kinase